MDTAVDAALDADVAGSADEAGGDAAGGGAPAPHASTNHALANSGASRHAREQASDDQKRFRLIGSGVRG
jgi:hypothetical protein